MSSPVIHFDAKSPAQKLAIRAFQSRRVLFLLGPAGTGKSHCALGLALDAYRQGKIKNIYLSRPLIEAGEKMGFLPGDVSEKLSPYMAPFEMVQSRIMYGKLPPGVIQQVPLAFMRGMTFSNCVAILDEAQNTTLSQLRLFLSRMGEGCTLLIVGDPDQSDLPSPRAHDFYTDLDLVADRLLADPAVSVIDFPSSHNLRDPLVSRILDRLA